MWLTLVLAFYARADQVFYGQQIKNVVTRQDLKEHSITLQHEILADLKRSFADERIEITLDDLEFLVDKELISGPTAKKVWDALLVRHKARKTIDTEDFYDFHDAMFFGIFSVVSLFYGIGSIVMIWGYSLAVRLAFEQSSPGFLLLSSLGFGSIFYAAAITLHYSYNSGLIAGCLFLTCNLAVLLATHAFLALSGLNTFHLELEDAVPVGKYRIKLFLTLVNLGVSYYFSLICCFPIVQVPFYFSLAYLAAMVGILLHFSVPLVLSPFCVLFMTLYAVGLLVYLTLAKSAAFKIDLLPAVARVDFRFMGYMNALFILSWSVPMIMCVNYFGDHQTFKENLICYPTIKSKWFNTEYKGELPRHWCLNEVWSFAYLGFCLATVVFGIFSGCWVVIISGQVFTFFALSSMPHSDDFFPDKSVYPILYATLFIPPLLLDEVVEVSQPQISFFFKDYLLWSGFVWVARLLCAVMAAWGAASAQYLSSLSYDPQVASPGKTFDHVWCFLLNYAVSLCLFVLAENETSLIISVLYSAIAMVLYYKAILTKPVSDQLSTENVIAFNTIQFLSGIRITLIAKNLVLIYFLGVMMMTVALLRTYNRRAKHFSFFFVAFSYLITFLVFAVSVKSTLIFIIAILTLYWILASELSISSGRFAIFGVLIAVTGLCAIAFKLNFSQLFETIQNSLQRTEGFNKLFSLMSEPDILIPEKRLVSEGLMTIKAWLLSLQIIA